MTYLFTNIRLGLYAFQAVLAGTVLGLSGYFASIFLPHMYKEYTIYSVVVSSLTVLLIISFLTLTHIFSPRGEVILLFILSILWLTLAAWTVDRRDFIGPNSDCESWGDKRITTNTGNKTISAFEYCNEMRVIEAFSWVLFGVFTIFFLIVANLTSIAVERGGRPYAWREPMIELPWYGEWPGYSGGPGSMYPTMQMPGGGVIPGTYIPGTVLAQPGGPVTTMPVMQDGGYVVQQQHGYSMIITPGMNGQAPMIQQVPGRISSV